MENIPEIKNENTKEKEVLISAGTILKPEYLDLISFLGIDTVCIEDPYMEYESPHHLLPIEKKNEYAEDLIAEGQISDGSDLAESDYPVVTLCDYLENASLLSAVDVSAEESSNKIALMTAHSSKGLEFPYVFVAGMEENIFPSGGFMISETEVEEERRLFYVAMTRAKKAVAFSFAQTRTRNGKHESNSPSRFVKEVDPQYIANPLSSILEDDDQPDQVFGGWGRSYQSKTGYAYGQSSKVQIQKRPAPVQPVRRPDPVRRSEPQPVKRPQVLPQRTPDKEFEPTPILQLNAGQRIEHNRFGYGRIVEITGNAVDLKARIVFDDHGEKILILKYAKIRAIEVDN